MPLGTAVHVSEPELAPQCSGALPRPPMVVTRIVTRGSCEHTCSETCPHLWFRTVSVLAPGPPERLALHAPRVTGPLGRGCAAADPASSLPTTSWDLAPHASNSGLQDHGIRPVLPSCVHPSSSLVPGGLLLRPSPSEAALGFSVKGCPRSDPATEPLSAVILNRGVPCAPRNTHQISVRKVS